MATELRLFSDYRQIHILDRASAAELADYWSRFDQPLHAHLALAEDAVGVVTGVLDDVTVAIDVTDGPPLDDRDAFAHVMECSLRADSGQLVVTAPTYGEDDGERVSVPEGWLRLRISLTRSPDDEEWGEDEESDEDGDDFDRDDTGQHIRVQCWLAAPTDPILVKGWDPDAGREVSS